MAARQDPKAKARALVVAARAKGNKLIAEARAKAKRLLAAAQAKAKAMLAKARARAQGKAKAEREKPKRAPTPKRTPQPRKPATRGDRAAKMTAKEIKSGNPRIPVEGVLSAINAFYANPEFKGPLFIGAIRTQRSLLGKHEIDYQITELARMGLIRLLRTEDVHKRGIDVQHETRSKGYPWAAPEYVALEKVK